MTDIEGSTRLSLPPSAEPARGALVVGAVARMAAGVDGRLDQRPAQVLRSGLGQRSAAIDLAGLVDLRAGAGVAGRTDCSSPVAR